MRPCARRVRAYGWKVSNAIDRAVKELPDYEHLKHGFNLLLEEQSKNARKAGTRSLPKR